MDGYKQTNRHRTATPLPPPPHPPPPPSSMPANKYSNENISPSSSKLKQDQLVGDPLPPTPPPSAYQSQKKFTPSNANANINKIQSPFYINKCNLPLPPTFNNTNSPFQITSSRSPHSQKHQFCSKSVDSPRTPLNSTLNNYINNNINNKSTGISKSLKKACCDSNDQDYEEVDIDEMVREKEEKEARSSSIIRKSELFDKILARLERK